MDNACNTLIKLKYDQRPDGLDEAVVPVRWCLEKPLFDVMMRGRTRKDPPYLLIVVWNEQTCDEQRMLVPLEQPLVYLSFVAHGINKVWAIAITREYGDEEQLERKFMRYSSGAFSTSLVSRYGYLFDEALPPGTSVAELTFNVRPDLFAKEPAAWERWWVNYWWGGKMPPQQCDFRKRRIIAYSIQPLVLPIWWLAKFAIHLIVALICRVLLLRGVNWYFVFRPWAGWPPDIPADRSEWFFEKHVHLSPFMPLLMFFVGNVLYIVNFSTLALPFFRGLKGYLLLIALAPLVMYALYFLMVGIAKLIDKPLSAVRSRRSEVKKRNNLPLALRDPEVMQALICDGVPKRARIEDLPAKVVTLGMRFNAVKKGVCRPYSR